MEMPCVVPCKVFSERSLSSFLCLIPASCLILEWYIAKEENIFISQCFEKSIALQMGPDGFG